ncbi:hypothetical protein FHW02_000803 [Ochrobactrum sp. RH1CCR137]|nr:MULTISPECIES: hypothetical protein [unclassified Ochrobactrum]MBA8842787.1 hypothetical protein [Ochrobactrum sp. RH1CCR137]
MFGEDLRYWKNHSQDVSTPVQLLEMLALFLRIIPRKTVSHFCWKCSLFFCALSYAKPLLTFAGNARSFSAHYPTQNRFSLLLEMLDEKK